LTAVLFTMFILHFGHVVAVIVDVFFVTMF